MFEVAIFVLWLFGNLDGIFLGDVPFQFWDCFSYFASCVPVF